MMMRKIKYVEDNEMYAMAIDYMLRDQYEVAVYGSAEEYLLDVSPADVIVLDQLLPGMSGLELVRKIRFKDPLVSIILLTAYDTDEIRKEAKQLGVNAVLRKTGEVVNNLQFHLEREFDKSKERRVQRLYSRLAAAASTAVLLVTQLWN